MIVVYILKIGKRKADILTAIQLRCHESKKLTEKIQTIITKLH